MTSKFMIGPVKEGLREDVKPWATPEDSFTTMTNAYQFRGRIVKRSGYTSIGRLQTPVTIPGATVFLTAGSVNLFSALGLSASFSVVPGSINLTTTDDGQLYTDPGLNGVLVGSLGGSGTINYVTGLLSIVAGGGSAVTGTFSYYTNLPVMGLRTQEGFDVGVQTLIAFDTIQAYKFTGVIFTPLPSVMQFLWSGTNYQFFFTTNYAGGFWATNSKPGLNGVKVTNAVAGGGFTTITTATPHGFTSGQTVYLINLGGTLDLNGNGYVITVTGPNTFTIPFATTGVYTANGIALNSYVAVPGQDGIRYYGALTNGNGWANYNPPINTTTALMGCLLIFPYRGYLVFLNTTEGNDQGSSNFGNRARWTQIGTPYYSPPVPLSPNPQSFDAKAVRDDIFGRGGANDAPTSEVIVGAEFIRDILVVYFERSTWRLRFVNNAQNPFVWERVNVELGSDCTFSTIAFDKGVMSISTRGIVISDANDTIRIDEKIPDEIFNIRQTNNGLERVYGVRTFRTKLNYWTFPSADNPNGIFPDKVLVLNYDTQNWSFFDDCFTCFGYCYNITVGGYTWEELIDAWASYTNISWNSGVSELGFENIAAGNQQGYVFSLETTSGQNAPSLSISAVSGMTFTSPNNNLPDGSWVTLSTVNGVTSSDGVSLDGRNFKVSNPTLDPNNFSLQEFEVAFSATVSGSTAIGTINFQNILPGSIQINVGSLVFFDTDLDGILYGTGGFGTFNYSTGTFHLTFVPPLAPSTLIVRLVSLDPSQEIDIITTTGSYIGGGQIAKISGIDIQSKFFNFFGEDQRARLSMIDFYVNSTTNGQFTCNVFADSSNVPINTPLSDNPQSNVVLTSTNPYQIGEGTQTLFRLYCDAIAQSLQLQFTFTDQQMAIDAITNSDIQILSMIFNMRKGGRLV